MLCTYYLLSLVLDTKDRNMNKTFFPLMKLWLIVQVDNLANNYNTASNYKNIMGRYGGIQRSGS